MSDGKDLNGFTSPKVNDASVWSGVQYASDPRAAFPAKDVSTQGNAGFNAEGSYESGNRPETNAYSESENM